MPEYAVHVTTDATSELTDDQVDDLMDALAPYSASIGGSPASHGLSAQLTVDAASMESAVRDGAAAVVEAVGLALRHGLADEVRRIGVTAVDVMTMAAFEQWLNTPQRPDDLVSTTEAAGILGVSRQRILQLATSHPDFPESERIGASRYWSAAALRRFRLVRDRGSARESRPAYQEC